LEISVFEGVQHFRDRIESLSLFGSVGGQGYDGVRLAGNADVRITAAAFQDWMSVDLEK
jgi:hypothetical protein